FAPELRLVAAHLRLYVEELHDQCAIEKVGPRGTQVGNRIEHYRTGSIEDRFVMIAIEFPATETAAGGQPASCVGEFLWQVTQVIEAYDPGIPCRRGQVANFTGYAPQRPGARVDERADYSARGRLARSLLTLGDKDRARHARTQRRDQKGLDQSPALVVDVQEAAQFVEAAAALGCGQRPGAACAMEPRGRSIYYPPTFGVDLDRSPGAIAQVEIEFPSVICDPQIDGRLLTVKQGFRLEQLQRGADC